MKDEDLYGSFSSEQIEEYRQEVIDRWGEAALKETEGRMKSWTPEDRARIEREGKEIITGIVDLIEEGPENEEVQAFIARYYKYISNFYDYTPEIFKSLGQGYVDDERFAAYFNNFHPELAQFMCDAIAVYVDGLQDQS